MANTILETIDRQLHKALFSSPVFIPGQWNDEQICITHAFAGARYSSIRKLQEVKGPASRRYYIFAFKAPSEEVMEISEEDKKRGGIERRHIPDYSGFVETIISSLSALFGKQMDFHGLIESSGLFYQPMLDNADYISDVEMGPYNDSARADLEIIPNWTNIAPIAALYCSDDLRLRNTFSAAARLYRRALASYHHDPENSYIDLVVVLEIIAEYYTDKNSTTIPDVEIYDSQLIKLFASLPDSDVRLLKKRLYQVWRKFSYTIKSLVSDVFFSKTEQGSASWQSITRENFSTLIRSVYELRSLHMHTGMPFGHIVIAQSDFNSELSCAYIEDEEIRRKCSGVLTFKGLERVARFCLLRLLHLNGIYVHPDLDEGKNATVVTESASKGET